MASNKVIIEFLAKVNQGDMANARKQFEDLKNISEKALSAPGVSKTTERSATAVLKMIQENYRKIEVLKAKGEFGPADTRRYNTYLSSISQGFKELIGEFNSVKLAPTERFKELSKALTQVRKDSKETADQIRAGFVGKVQAAGFTDITSLSGARAKRKELTGFISERQKELTAQAPDSAAAKIAIANDIELQKAIASREKLARMISLVDAALRKEATSQKTQTDALQAEMDAEQKASKGQYDDYIRLLIPLLTQLSGATREEVGAVQQLTTEQEKNVSSGKKIENTIGGLESKILNATSAAFLFSKAWQAIKKSFADVANIDKQITQIGIVSRQSGEEVWKSFEMFNQAAATLSTTTKQYLEGAKIFYQQGMNTAQVMKMVEATTMAAALSEVSFRDASETLTAAINAYQMKATDAMSITDKFSAVGAASAADFRELSIAMEKVASQAYSSGMSFDSLLGILAKGIETTREAPEAIGTGLKSIIARFQEMKENPMAQLEDGLNANRVEKALKTVGVAVRDTNGEFRNMDDVFADLGSVWSNLSRNQRAYIATMAAGSR